MPTLVMKYNRLPYSDEILWSAKCLVDAPESKPYSKPKRVESRPARAIAVALVLSFGLLAGMYSIITPMWEAPDETRHFGYIQHLLTTRRLPVQQAGVRSQAHQPPLYYLLASIVASPADIELPTGAYRANPEFRFFSEVANISLHHTEETFPYRGQALAFHLARGASILMGMVTVGLTVAIGWRIFQDKPLIGLLAGALVAFNPQFLFINGSVNNDALLALTTTGILWQTTRMLTDKGRLIHWLVLGIWIAAAFLAKPSSFVVAGIAVAFVTLEYLSPQSHERPRKQLLQGILLTAGVIILLSGWWFIRNQHLYGDPLGWSAYKEIYAVNLRDGPLTWADLRRYATVQFQSFWGVFGWMNLRGPAWFYATMIGLTAVSAAGYVILLFSGRSGELRGASRRALPMMAMAVLAQEIFQTWAITINNHTWYQGRYLFPVVAPISLLLAIGLAAAIGLLPQRGRLWAAGGLVIVMAGIAVFMVLRIIAPAYETVPLSKSSVWLVPNRSDATYGDMIRLRGYEIESDRDGTALNITLYWQAIEQPDFDYSAFVHVTDGSGHLLGQKDGAPGEDLGYPPPAWLPEDIVRDQRVIELPEKVDEALMVHVGLYNWSNGQRLPARSTGSIVDDALVFSVGGD